MRKLVMFNMVSVDGYYAGVNDDISWHRVDIEFNRSMVDRMRQYDTILFGRKTYQLFETYWPAAAKDPQTSSENKLIAENINNMTKLVFSKSLSGVTWEHTELVRELDPKAINELKQQPGKDIVIYGSGTLVRQLADLGLIDEYRFMINPVILGAGKLLFAQAQPKNLTLVDRLLFESGNVMLTYEPHETSATETSGPKLVA